MKSLKAFTLIEVLVALWIITVAILGPLAAAINSSSTSRDTKDAVVSAYLAQESFELLRFVRDTMFLRCITGDSTCTSIALPAPATDNERSSESAWRLFKEILANGHGADSCFVAENSDGCTYDQEGFLDSARINPTLTPTIYSTTDPRCEYLNHNIQRQLGATTTSFTDGMYLCDNHTTYRRARLNTNVCQHSI
jgi:type II secretory pathway pseudopilin PulG